MRASSSVTTTPTMPPVVDRRRLWMAAIKPPMYTVAVVPIWVGTAVAAAESGTLDWGRFATFLGAAIAIAAVAWLCWQQRDWTVLGLIGVACFGGYTYQGPPFRLGYLGLGEPICFLTFGPLAIAAAAYSQLGHWSGAALAASVFVGITTSLILFCSHFHQVADDLAAGKRSPVARLGTARSAALLPWLCVLAFGPVVGCAIAGIFPVWTLLALLSVPLAVKLCRHVGANHAQPAAVSNCKFIAVALHFWSGLLFGLGFALPLWI